MIRRISSICPLCRPALLLALFALFTSCSDKKSSSQDSASSPPPQETAKNSPLTSAAGDAAARYFANLKPVVPMSADRAVPSGDLTFTIDVLDVKDRVARVRGWAFRLMPPHQKGDRVTVLLVSSGATYSTLADVEMRPDVSAVLKQTGLDDTGFVSLIDTTAVPPGEYTVFLRIGGAGGDAIKSTNRTLTL